MAECFVLCKECDTPIGGSEAAHQWHDPYECARFVFGSCRCDGWVCLSCCPEPACSPLQARMLEARAEVIADAEWAERVAGLVDS